MSSQASRSTFSKFSLKPSSLSQHTANFNKLLEQVPAPKLDANIDLTHASIIAQTNLEKPESNQSNQENIKESTQTTSQQASTEQSSSKEFIFGENITERVVNTTSENESNADNAKEAGETAETDNKTNGSSSSGDLTKLANQSTTNASNWLNDTEHDKYAHDAVENELYTLLKINCKLYVLDAEKSNWNERGYGILKVIETNEGQNCKIMMWTDKCYRVILNTKLFEKMQIDRANKKSIRFNGLDAGTIRIFLIKASNPNDCDELYDVLRARLEQFNSKQTESSSASNVNSQDDSKNKSSLMNSQNQKLILLKCNCTYSNIELNGSTSETNNKNAKLHLYMYDLNASNDSFSSVNSTSHQLYLDIVESENESKVLVSSYLKLVKIKKQRLNSSHETKPFVEFEINNLSGSKSASSVNYLVCINEKESASEFLKHFKREPHFQPDDSSSNGAFDKDYEYEGDHSEESECESEDDVEQNTASNNNDDEDEESKDGLKQTDDSQEQIKSDLNPDINADSETGESNNKRKRTDEEENDEDDDQNYADESESSFANKKKEPNPDKDLCDENSTETQISGSTKRNHEESSSQENEESNLKKTKILQEEASDQ